MNSQVKVRHPKVSTEELNDLIVDSIQDIKGKHILKLDLRNLDDAPAEFFIICEGDSTTQVKAIADNIYRRLKEEAHVAASHMEGTRNALWICIDYFTTVVHVFHRESRAFYELEDLWSDAVFTEYNSL